MNDEAVPRPAQWPVYQDNRFRARRLRDEALEALADVDPRKARVVELRYFAGLGVDECAEVLGVSADTVMRDWKMAKLWLLRRLHQT